MPPKRNKGTVAFVFALIFQLAILVMAFMGLIPFFSWILLIPIIIATVLSIIFIIVLYVR